MNTLSLGTRLLLPRPGRTLTRAALCVLIPLVPAVLWAAKGGHPALGLFCALFVVAQLAAAVSSAHKEVLAATPSFFVPGLRRRVVAAQAGWAVAEAAAVIVFLGVFAPEPGPALLATAGAAALAVHAALALAMLRLAWAFQLPLWLYYVYFLLPWLRPAADAGTLDPWLGRPLPWLVLAAALLALLGRTLLSRGLLRRLHGELVLGVDDVFRPSRVQAFKAARSRDERPDRGPAWRARLLGAVLARGAAARQAGRPATARAWLLAHAGMAQGITRRRWVLALVVLAVAALMVVGSYVVILDAAPDAAAFLAGLTYQWASAPLFFAAATMAWTGAVPGSRRLGLRSELLVLGWAMAATTALSLAAAAAFALLGEVMPRIPWQGATYPYREPALHGVWLAPLMAPFVWLGIALRPRARCSALSVKLAVVAFIAGHTLMSLRPAGTVAPWAVAAATAAGAAAFWLRRRWWQQGDQEI